MAEKPGDTIAMAEGRAIQEVAMTDSREKDPDRGQQSTLRPPEVHTFYIVHMEDDDVMATRAW